MKKSLFLFILLICSVCAFADTKAYMGVCKFEEVYSLKKNPTKVQGVFNRYAFYGKVESNYKYIEDTTTLLCHEDYFHVDNKLKLKWNIFYLGCYFDYSTFRFKKEMTNYLDFSIGVQFSKEVFDCITFIGDFNVGYVPLNHIHIFDNSDSILTTLKIGINFKQYIFFYAGVECIENKDISVFFVPLTVKNVIGIRGEYSIKNVGFYASIDYYCLHPEHSYGKNITTVNQNREYISLGMFYRF